MCDSLLVSNALLVLKAMKNFHWKSRKDEATSAPFIDPNKVAASQPASRPVSSAIRPDSQMAAGIELPPVWKERNLLDNGQWIHCITVSAKLWSALSLNDALPGRLGNNFPIKIELKFINSIVTLSHELSVKAFHLLAFSKNPNPFWHLSDSFWFLMIRFDSFWYLIRSDKFLLTFLRTSFLQQLTSSW